MRVQKNQREEKKFAINLTQIRDSIALDSEKKERKQERNT